MPTLPRKAAPVDVVVGDVVNLEPARRAAAQQHVGGIAAVETPKTNKLPIGSDLAQLIACQERIVPNVVDFVGAVRSAQDHVGRGADGGRRVRGHCKKAVVACTVSQGAYDVAIIVDGKCKGLAVRNGIVDGGENASAIEEGMGAAGVAVSPDDLAHIVDAECRGVLGGQGIVEGGVSAAVRIVEEAVIAGGVGVKPNDLAGSVDAEGSGAVGGQGVVEGRVSAAIRIVEEAVVAGGVTIGPNDLAGGVDAGRSGALGGQRVVEGDEDAAA